MSLSLEKVIELLHQAREASTCDKANFGMLKPAVTLNTAQEIDTYVKEAVSLYMSTWVQGPICHALTILEANKDLLAAQRGLCDQLHNGGLGNALQRMDKALQAASHQHYKD